MPADEKELARRVQMGDVAAFLELVSANVPLVACIVDDCRAAGNKHLNLFFRGMVGLMSAARSFDRTKGIKFQTHARYWILKYIPKSAQNRRRVVREFRAKLIRQRDCSKPVVRHDAKQRWMDRCRKARVSCDIPVGDVATFRAAIAVRESKIARKGLSNVRA